MLILKRFFADDSGATAIEYGLIAGVMAIAIVTCASIFTSKTAVVFSIITSAMDAATG